MLSSLPRPELAADEVEVWLADPAHLDAERDRLLALLDPGERARHDRFHFERDRRIFRAAHALLRCVLSRYEPRAPASWRFSTNEYGRPDLDPTHRWLRFNLSHTCGLVAVAVAAERAIGVDVERVVPARATDDLAAYAFSPAELAAFRALSHSAQIGRFFALWTCKEAYIKGRGMGLALPLDRFSVVLDDDAPQLEVDAAISDGLPWRLEHRDLEAHHLAVARVDDAATTHLRVRRVRALNELDVAGGG